MRTHVITGASEGIGAELARQLARERRGGAALVLAARNADKLADVAAQCEALGAATLVVPTDVSREDDCRALVDRAASHFGGIDVLVNNAGISAHARFEDVRAQDLRWYQDLMTVNLWGSVWCTHAALPYLKESRGQLVAVSSLAGLLGVPGRTAYSATKFAMTGFFEALRTELMDSGVSVTIAYPGVVATELRRHGWNAQGREAGRSGLDEAKAMPVEECARLIREGIEDRARDVVMTAQGKAGRFLKLLVPGVVDRMVLRALARDPK